MPTGSSRLLRAIGPIYMLSHGVAPDRVYSTGMSPCGGWALTPPFHPYPRPKASGGIFLLHLSEGHPWRALPVILALWSPDFPHVLPVILALWSPDFPHVQAFALHPRPLGLLTGLILSNPCLQVNKNLVFEAQKFYNKIVMR